MVRERKTYLRSELGVKSFHQRLSHDVLPEKASQLLNILAQPLEVSLIVWTLHEAHLMRQEIPLVGPLGVKPLTVVEFAGAVVVVVVALSVLLG